MHGLSQLHIILVVQVMVLGFATSWPRRDERIKESDQHVAKPIVHPKKSYCSYNNKTYESGDRFRPDSCTFCHCPKHSDRVQCAVQDCKFQANCVRYVKKNSGECCGQCVEIGCKHTDGQIYKPKQVVLENKCEQCHCPAGGGRVQCNQVRCPVVNCVDPVKPDGDSCCEICPNGQNCWMDQTIISANRLYQKDNCKTCQCPRYPLPFWMRGRKIQAVCSNSCV